MVHRRLRIAIASTLLLAAGAAACAAQDVPVAQEIACSDSFECGAVAYCAKPSCSAPRGRCEPRPSFCDDQQAPTCGCDGVNYWNDCLRQKNGIPAFSPGECTSQYPPCGGFRGTACQTAGALCAHLVLTGANNCDPSNSGACWVLPPRCPADAGGEQWESCGLRPEPCLDTCEAIRAERPFRMPVFPTACP
jgi:hypothetical protein